MERINYRRPGQGLADFGFCQPRLNPMYSKYSAILSTKVAIKYTTI
jgi:hypothetical protein